jgi:hypothetical protein
MSPLPADKVRVSGVAVVALANKITYNQTSFDVAGDLTDWPTSDFEIAIDDELIHVGTRDGTTFSDLTRGVEDTDDTHHNKQAEVSYVKTGAELASPAPGGGSTPVYAVATSLSFNVPIGAITGFTADSDPDGFLVADTLVVPAGKGGVYLCGIFMDVSPSTNDFGSGAFAALFDSGADALGGLLVGIPPMGNGNEAATAPAMPIALADGDILTPHVSWGGTAAAAVGNARMWLWKIA